MDQATARAFALLATAIARTGTGMPPAQLMAEATQYVPWIAQTAVAMSLAVKGASMPLTIDSVNSVAVLAFEDRDKDAVAPPAGTTAKATSSDPAVMTVGAGVPGTDANGVATIEFPLAEVAAGTSTLTVTATDASGAPLLGPDGTTLIPDPPPVVVTVKPGAAAAEIFTVPGN